MQSRAIAIAVIYGVTATLWIYFSDSVLAAIVPDPVLIVRWSVYKGIAFVLVTSALLFVLMRRAFGTTESALRTVQKARKQEQQAEEEGRRADAEAIREKQFSEVVLESLPGVMYLYDSSGQFIRWNQNFLDVTGYAGDELQTMLPTDFFTGEERDLVAARIGDVFTHGESSVEANFVKKDGSSTPYYFTGRLVVLDGEPCLIGMGIDIRKRVEAEAGLRRLNENLENEVAHRTEELRGALIRAESADRLKSAFLATMSHELRTPLNSIIGFTGIVLKGLPGPLNPEQTKQLSMVQNSARHLLALINDVLDLSKIEAGRLQMSLEPCDIDSLVAKAVESLVPIARDKGLELTFVPNGGPGTVPSDSRRINQILFNLLSNAVKFTEHGGVTVSSRVETRTGGQTGPLKGQVVAISISDTGPGISPADLATLFQPFRQLDTGLSRRHEGTGLGLVICRRLARLLGGEIEVSSDPGRGSTFTLILPVDPPETPEG